MAQFIITCEHKAAECEELDGEMQAFGIADVMKGKDFFCSCPYDYHGGWVAVEGENAEAIMASLPPVFRSHAKVFQVESMRFE